MSQASGYPIWPGYDLGPIRVETTVTPAVEPVSLAEAKAWRRILFTDDDTLISDIIVACRERIEVDLKRALITQTKVVYMGGWPSGWGKVSIPYPPLQSIVSVDYLGFDGVLRSMDPASYLWNAGSTPGAIWLPYGTIWPISGPYPDAVRITYTCGYGDAPSDVPMTVRLAMRSLIAATYENREAYMSGDTLTMTDLYLALLSTSDYGYYS